MSAPIDDGGPAFPVTEEDSSGQFRQFFGMSLRDYAAIKLAAALIGTIRESDRMTAASQPPGWLESGIAKGAYRFADAMLAARKEKP